MQELHGDERRGSLNRRTGGRNQQITIIVFRIDGLCEPASRTTAAAAAAAAVRAAERQLQQEGEQEAAAEIATALATSAAGEAATAAEAARETAEGATYTSHGVAM